MTIASRRPRLVVFGLLALAASASMARGQAVQGSQPQGQSQGQPQAATQGPPQGAGQARPAAQGAATARDSTPRLGRRRALDIRATAPAPEVVTIRPRAIPAFDRAMALDSVLALSLPRGNGMRGTVVLLPGVLPFVRPDSVTRPNPPE
ncbi:MAG: hypothetical protein FJ202_07025 [Gemmatimonadetes bacterium]|nr:hypothetical protein [Gemmatimonadota bacterium]